MPPLAKLHRRGEECVNVCVSVKGEEREGERHRDGALVQ